MRRHITRWAPLALASVALTALLAGCSGAAPDPGNGGGGGNAAASGNGDAVNAPPVKDADCGTIISDKDMQKATGLKDIALEAASGTEKQGEQFCPYRSATYNLTVIVGVFKGGGFDTTYIDMEKTANMQNPQKVTGLGDSAAWADAMNTLVVRKGQTGLSVMLQNANKTNVKDPKKTSSAVAKLVLGKI
ncbi:hypothetical protein GCM10009682_62590 [Luedemannella flava]|uniref:DUF3558 domain-containing protein n=1 Tax=Luedemannella flava TaxID=349316 RepID=A0ABP4Z480_9ACTN